MIWILEGKPHQWCVIVSVLILPVGIAQVYKWVKSVALWSQKIYFFLHIRGNQQSFLHGLI